MAEAAEAAEAVEAAEAAEAEPAEAAEAADQGMARQAALYPTKMAAVQAPTNVIPGRRSTTLTDWTTRSEDMIAYFQCQGKHSPRHWVAAAILPLLEQALPR